ncbi:MAG: YtxH domain-containing protein [Acidimicrobiales bacterium]
MKFKSGLIAGVALGYYLATRIDPETRRRFESKVNERVAHLRDDPRVQDVVDSVSSVAGEVIDKIDDRAAT